MRLRAEMKGWKSHSLLVRSALQYLYKVGSAWRYEMEDKDTRLVSSCGSKVAFKVISTWYGLVVVGGAPSS